LKGDVAKEAFPCSGLFLLDNIGMLMKPMEFLKGDFKIGVACQSDLAPHGVHSGGILDKGVPVVSIKLAGGGFCKWLKIFLDEVIKVVLVPGEKAW
jgi:hypothetical protein